MNDISSAFDELMARSGVRPLGEKGAKNRDRPKRPAQPTPAAAPPSPAPAAVRPAPVAPTPITPTPVAPTPVAPAPAAVRPPPTARPPVPAPPREGDHREVWLELERLRRELSERTRELAELRAGMVAEGHAREALLAEHMGLRAALADADQQRLALEERVSALDADRQEIELHRRSLQRALEEAQGALPPPPVTARAVFEARGLVGDSELDLVLRGLGEQREAGGLLSLLQAASAEALESFLEDRVSLHCGDPTCPAPPGRVVLRVSPVRCDVCGGSDIRKAVKRFQDAALLNGLARVVIVGGSPQYHRQLRALLTDARVKLALVPGDRRRTARQAQSDELGADLVVLWGATIIDHSLSDLYGRGEGRVVRVPHRGIARMLEKVAEALD